MKRKTTENHTHIHVFGGEHGNWLYPVKTIIYFILFLLLFANGIAWIDEGLNKKENIYKSCTYTCSQKHFEGSNVGMDGPAKPFVYEFDRTQCIESCNKLYLELRQRVK